MHYNDIALGSSTLDHEYTSISDGFMAFADEDEVLSDDEALEEDELDIEGAGIIGDEEDPLESEEI